MKRKQKVENAKAEKFIARQSVAIARKQETYVLNCAAEKKQERETVERVAKKKIQEEYPDPWEAEPEVSIKPSSILQISGPPIVPEKIPVPNCPIEAAAKKDIEVQLNARRNIDFTATDLTAKSISNKLAALRQSKNAGIHYTCSTNPIDWLRDQVGYEQNQSPVKMDEIKHLAYIYDPLLVWDPIGRAAAFAAEFGFSKSQTYIQLASQDHMFVRISDWQLVEMVVEKTTFCILDI